MRLSVVSMAGLAWGIVWPGAAHAGARDLSALPVVEVSAQQYPPALAARRLEGTVIVALDIAQSGELRCTVPPGGDAPELARPSCTLIAQRDIFPPDLDRSGRAIPTHMRVAVRWRLRRSDHDFGGAIPLSPDRWVRRQDYAIPQLLSGVTGVKFTITAMGRVQNCGVVKSSRYLVLDGWLCPLLQERAVFLPALSPTGQPVATQGEYSWLWPFGTHAD